MAENFILIAITKSKLQLLLFGNGALQ